MIWTKIINNHKNICFKINIGSKYELYRQTWHPKGDFFATIRKKPESVFIFLHKITLKRSQQPFIKNIGCLEDV